MALMAVAKALDENPKITISVTSIVGLIGFSFMGYFWLTANFASAEDIKTFKQGVAVTNQFFTTQLELNRLNSDLNAKMQRRDVLQDEVDKGTIKAEQAMKTAIQARGRGIAAPPIPSDTDMLILQRSKNQLAAIIKEIDDLNKQIADMKREADKYRNQMVSPNQTMQIR